jgi:hypothetical protein
MGVSSKIRYSPNEEKLLLIMRECQQPVTAIGLVDLFFDDSNVELPYHAHHQINATMRSLMRKIDYNGEKFGIMKSQRRGPHPIEFRFVERINRRRKAAG